jgi:hypothetical protein
MRKLTQEEKAFLDKLYADKELRFRGYIRQFIITNTYEPKYKVGECVRVTIDNGEYIYGKPIRNVKMKITEILWFTDTKGTETITYGGIALEKGTNNDFYICAEERIDGTPTNRHIIGKATDNLNTFEKRNDTKQSIDFNL